MSEKCTICKGKKKRGTLLVCCIDCYNETVDDNWNLEKKLAAAEKERKSALKSVRALRVDLGLTMQKLESFKELRDRLIREGIPGGSNHCYASMLTTIIGDRQRGVDGEKLGNLNESVQPFSEDELASTLPAKDDIKVEYSGGECPYCYKSIMAKVCSRSGYSWLALEKEV